MDEIKVKDYIRDKIITEVLDYLNSDQHTTRVASLINSLRLVYPNDSKDHLCKRLVDEQCRALRWIADKTEDKMVDAMAAWREREKKSSGGTGA